MKKLNNIYPAIFFVFLIGIKSNVMAQQNMRISELVIGDSIRFQSTLGLFYYGYYAGSNDSIFKYSYQANLENPKNVKVKQIAEILLLNRITPVSNDLPIEENKNREGRQDITSTENNETTEGEANTDILEPKKLPKNRNQAAQILAGGGMGYVGALGGGIAGALIGTVLDNNGLVGPFLGGFIGSISGSVVLNAYIVYKIGNTSRVKGKFVPTLVGTTIGMLAGIIVWPISPFVASTGGLIAFNKSRKLVEPLDPNKFNQNP